MLKKNRQDQQDSVQTEHKHKDTVVQGVFILRSGTQVRTINSRADKETQVIDIKKQKHVKLN